MCTLKNKGIKIGVVTSGKNKNCEIELRECGILQYIDIIIGSNDTKFHKPDPTPAIICCKKLNISPKDAIMVGDSRHDIACGNSAGCKTVFVSWSFCNNLESLNKDPSNQNKEEVLNDLEGVMENIEVGKNYEPENENDIKDEVAAFGIAQALSFEANEAKFEKIQKDYAPGSAEEQEVISRAHSEDATEHDKDMYVLLSQTEMFAFLYSMGLNYEDLDRFDKGILVKGIKTFIEDGKEEEAKVLMQKLGITREIVDDPEWNNTYYVDNTLDEEDAKISRRIKAFSDNPPEGMTPGHGGTAIWNANLTTPAWDYKEDTINDPDLATIHLNSTGKLEVMISSSTNNAIVKNSTGLYVDKNSFVPSEDYIPVAPVTGQSGKVLTNNGTETSWRDALPLPPTSNGIYHLVKDNDGLRWVEDTLLELRDK